jgi:hypothetical protein
MFGSNYKTNNHFSFIHKGLVFALYMDEGLVFAPYMDIVYSPTITGEIRVNNELIRSRALEGQHIGISSRRIGSINKFGKVNLVTPLSSRYVVCDINEGLLDFIDE